MTWSINSSSPFYGWRLFFCGICMGAADLVPGISGGTIAFILGLYQPLLESLQTLNRSSIKLLFQGKWKTFSQQVAWKFLLTLGAGILCALVSLAHFFHFILSHEIYRIYLYSLFLGLIVASFVFCIRQIKIWTGKIIGSLCLGIGIAYLLTEATLVPKEEGQFSIPIEVNVPNMPLRNYDTLSHLLKGLSSESLGALLAQGLIEEYTPVYNQENIFVGFVGNLAVSHSGSMLNVWLIFCGILAICALLLPGISGSYVLNLLGVYPIVIEALVEFLTSLSKASFNMEAFSILGSLGLGIIFGALGFARVLSWLFRHYPRQSLALLSGFMLGAIRSVWPFWTYEYMLLPLNLNKGPQLVVLHPFFPSWYSPITWYAIAYGVIGFLALFAIEAYHKRKKANVGYS